MIRKLNQIHSKLKVLTQWREIILNFKNTTMEMRDRLGILIIQVTKAKR